MGWDFLLPNFVVHFGSCVSNWVYWQWHDWLRTLLIILGNCLAGAVALYLVIKFLPKSSKSKDGALEVAEKPPMYKEPVGKPKPPPAYDDDDSSYELPKISSTPAWMYRVTRRLFFRDRANSPAVKYSKVPQYDM